MIGPRRRPLGPRVRGDGSYISTRRSVASIESRVLSFPVALACLALGACKPTQRIVIEDAWSPPAPPTAPVAAAYMAITTVEPDVLLSAATPIAQRVEMHMTSTTDGVMKMRALERVAIAAGETMHFEPGGRHFMLVNLSEPQAAGTSFPMTLRFERAGEMTVQIPVRAAREQ